jgi:hypothetical protein
VAALTSMLTMTTARTPFSRGAIWGRFFVDHGASTVTINDHSPNPTVATITVHASHT